MTIDVRRLQKIGLFLVLATPLLAHGATGIPDRSNWQYVGAENPSKTITVTVWLKQRNKAELNEMVQRMYEKGSPTFHHWLTRAEYRQRFAPTAEAAAQARSYLTARGFTVTSVDKFNHYVSAQGSVGNVEKTFNVALQRVNVNGEIHRVSNTEASISGPVGELVRGVTGLDDFRAKNALARPINPATGKPLDGRPLTMADIGGPAHPCLIGAPVEETYSYAGVSATYSGNSYSGFAPSVGGWCTYIPSQIRAGYGLNALYGNGWDGTGQTIIIVGAWGSNSIEADANTFSTAYGLPALTSSNFHIYYPGGKVRCGKGCNGWNIETTLDVEWAHTVAPGANIALVLAPDNTNTIDVAELWAIENAEEISTPYANGDLGYVISNSWLSYGENQIPKSVLYTEYDYTQLAAALGISVNFSSGDGGGPGNLVAMPASSPYATAVGGTSLFMDSNGVVQYEVGWGNTFAQLADIHGHPYDPPNGFFDGGSGGGTSAIWPAPSFQSSLGNSYRELPDISYLADAFTGVNIIITYGGKLQTFAAGGTSLSCPMFSALWAIANQAAGSAAPLGQAAAMLYSLPADAITDIVPVGSDTNATGTITDSSGTTTYTANDLVNPKTSAPYISVLDLEQCAGNSINCNKSNLFWGELVGFGTDSALFTAPGWDNVTGMGVPNGLPFVQDVVAALP